MQRDRALAQLQLQIERMPVGYLLGGVDLCYVDWNPAAQTIFGYTKEEVIGKHPFEVIVPSQAQEFVAAIFERLRGGDMNAHGIVVNARDAMPDGGKITIETDNAALDEDYCRHHEGVTPGAYAVLAVSDTGTGMEEAVRLHIFEPFFTTKAKGRGTGLGLATVHGIVKQAGGHIWLYSEPGKGTTFKIYLPRTTAPVEVLAAPLPQSTPSGGFETILLVEDEPAVRALAAQVLRGRGYTVLEAINGEEALRLVKGLEPEIVLLVTDVIMPQMNGKELADRLQAIHPALKILYASGYTENTIVHHGVLDPGVAFLSKPFTPTGLAHKVREVLDGRSG
jgi:two-component system cell cycle sensor histidine kinase/response regulator CckA